MNEERKKCLIIVDMQNDFLDGGSLCVAGGSSLIPKINELKKNYDLVVFTQDWHPSDHVSFAINHANAQPFTLINLNGKERMLWPVHCVANTFGSEIHREMIVSPKDIFVKKGVNKNYECYSGFFDEEGNSTGLVELLIENGVSDVDVCGVATDYCVGATWRDSAKHFNSRLLFEYSAAVNEESARKLYSQINN